MDKQHLVALRGGCLDGEEQVIKFRGPKKKGHPWTIRVLDPETSADDVYVLTYDKSRRGWVGDAMTYQEWKQLP